MHSSMINLKHPIVSIIIPVYKVEKYLRNCIESVLAQTYENWEMILVDDGSPDECPAICDEYAARDSRVTALHQQNAGQSSARNRALDCPPKGDFVTFLDSDDFWHKDYLKNLVELALTYDAEIAQCGYVCGTENSYPKLKGKISIETYDNHSIFLSERANIVMWGKLFKKHIFENIRMPVGLYNEDDWTTWKLYYRAKNIVVTTKPLYYYTENPISTMARLGKKPDLRFTNAYDERIGFFVQTGEKDLEHCSRLQLCKALVLTYRSKQLLREERETIIRKFGENWHVLRNSVYIRSRYKLLFGLFHFMPMVASRLATLARR